MLHHVFSLYGVIDWLVDIHWVRSLTVLMHPGLINRPFVSHNLDISPAEPCPFTKVLDGPRLKSQYPLGPRKEPKYTHFGVCRHFYMCPAKRWTYMNVCWNPRKRNPSPKWEKHQVMEPHVDRRPTYSGVRPCSRRGPLTTLLSLPQPSARYLPPRLG
jgi:hypothetical protein